MDPVNETVFQYLPQEMQADQSLAAYKEVKALDLLKSHAELSNQVKTAGETQAQFEARLKTAIEPLPENATEDQRKEYATKIRTLNQVPDKPDGYQLKLPESVKADDPLLSAFLQSAHKEGMSPAQAQAGVDAFVSYAAQAEAAQREGTDNALKIQWGAKYEENLKKAYLTFEAIAKEAGVPEAELGKLAYLRSNVHWMNMMFSLARHYSEDGLKGGGGPRPAASDISSAAKRWYPNMA